MQNYNYEIEETAKQRLEIQNNSAHDFAERITIDSNESYEEAADFLKNVKSHIKTVEGTFADMKEQAHKAHKAVCDKENEFKKPLVAAEKVVKSKMQVYLAELEKQRLAAEKIRLEEQKRLADEQLKKAAQLEAEGKTVEAEAVFKTATLIDNLNVVTDSAPAVKVEGISTVSDYEIEVTDAEQVPAYINGFEIREINIAAIKRLVKASGGKLIVPGVKITPIKTIRAR